MKRLLVLLGTLGTSAILLPGCGYSLAGRGNFLPEYIATIAIPTFANRTNQIAIEELFTQKVVEEFTSRGRYRIQAEREGADAVLEGTVVTLTTTPTVLEGSTGQDSQQASQAATYTVIVRAQVEFRDLVKDNVIWSSNNFQFRDDYEIGDNPDDFFNQEGLTFQRLAEEFAKSLVSSILEAF